LGGDSASQFFDASESKGHKSVFIDVPIPALRSRNRDICRRRTAKAYRHLVHAETRQHELVNFPLTFHSSILLAVVPGP